MKHPDTRFLLVLAGGAILIATALSVQAAKPVHDWKTVINNTDLIPPLEVRNFNSYNQPSVNLNGLVVIRARSRGGPPLGPATHGIYTRDMAVANSPVVSVLDRTSQVPEPNNLDTLFIETPSFPRIDTHSDTLATRGNHRPVWRYILEDGTETRTGTTGIYTDPFGPLITGVGKLGDVEQFSFLEVPEFPGTRFEVFPGAPSVSGEHTIVFKGNYTVNGIGKTGVYYRRLVDDPILGGPGGGTLPVVMIANNTHTMIPGTNRVFGSTSPPSAAEGRVVFAGFDDENSPTLGGIYLARLQPAPPLHALVEIGEKVPAESARATFKGLGEGGAFDGRYVGFWGSWGSETRTVRLYCPSEGNRDRIAFCNRELVCEETGELLGDMNSVCDDENDPMYGIRCYQDKEIPLQQGIFAHDTKTGKTHVVAKTGAQHDDFLFWNYSGRTPCTSSTHAGEGSEDDGEPARWRSSAYVAVSMGPGATFRTAFKAAKDSLTGIYLARGPGKQVRTILDTTMSGPDLDPDAPIGSTITELGIEREGLRGDWLAISARMEIEGGTEEEGMAGVYVTRLPGFTGNRHAGTARQAR